VQRKVPVLKLLREQFSGFLAPRGAMLHGWGEIWHGGVDQGVGPLLHATFNPPENFTPYLMQT